VHRIGAGQVKRSNAIYCYSGRLTGLKSAAHEQVKGAPVP